MKSPYQQSNAMQTVLLFALCTAVDFGTVLEVLVKVIACVLSNKLYHLVGFGNISGLFCFCNSTHCHALATVLFLRLYFYELWLKQKTKMYWSCVVYLGVGEEEYRVFNFQESTGNAWRMQGIKFRFLVDNTSAKSSKVFLASFFCHSTRKKSNQRKIENRST